MNLLERLIGHDTWTTRRLLELSGTLTDEQLDREFDIGHGNVRKTFDHMVWNVECWTDLMMSRTVRPRSSDCALTALTSRFDEAAHKYESAAPLIFEQDRLDDVFTDTLDNPPQSKSYGGLIVHLATHGMHHRAQLLYMLRRLGVEELPEGDVLTWEQTVGVSDE